jgi:hypothetical protein
VGCLRRSSLLVAVSDGLRPLPSVAFSLPMNSVPILSLWMSQVRVWPSVFSKLNVSRGWDTLSDINLPGRMNLERFELRVVVEQMQFTAIVETQHHASVISSECLANLDADYAAEK